MQDSKKDEVLSAIKLEVLRDRLSDEGNNKEFLKTYKKGNPEIKNYNFGKFWDIKNRTFILDRYRSPMAWDRTRIVYSWVYRYIKHKDVSILNIGFGPGNLESLINSQHVKCRWDGVDISEESIEKVVKKYKWGNFTKGDFLSAPIKKGKYDIIVAMEVLEHISPKDIFDFLSKTRKSLKPQGKFIISIPLNEGLPEMLEEGNNPNAHVRIYTPNIINTELLLSGFTKIRKIRYLYAFQNVYLLKSIIASLFHTHKSNAMLIECQKQ